MAFTVDRVARMDNGYGLVVRDDQSKKLIVSICYATQKDAVDDRDEFVRDYPQRRFSITCRAL